MILHSRPKRSDLYTLSLSKLLENHALHSGTYLYSPYMAVSPPGGKRCEPSLRRTAFASAAERQRISAIPFGSFRPKRTRFMP